MMWWRMWFNLFMMEKCDHFYILNIITTISPCEIQVSPGLTYEALYGKALNDNGERDA